MDNLLELEQAHHQARRYLVSLVWHLSKPHPDFDAAFDKAFKLKDQLGLCLIIDASITRQKAKEDAAIISDVCTEGRA